MTPDQKLAAYKRWHIKVVEVVRNGKSWRDHRRPASTGAWGNMHGTTTHHTGPWSTVAGMLALLWVGRSDLPGPLCDEATAPNGVLYMIANGRVNHAGKGANNVYQALIADKPLPRPGPDAIDGNAILYGNEVINNGTTQPYPNVQIETAVKAAAAKCEFHKWTANAALLHLGWTSRKGDWSALGRSQARFVAQVARALKEGPDVYGYPTSKPVVKPPVVAPVVKPPVVARPPVTPRGNVNLARLVTAFRDLNDDVSNDTEQVQVALNAVYGTKLRTDGIIDAATVAAYKEHQRRFGIPRTGVPAKWALEKLGFNVT